MHTAHSVSTKHQHMPRSCAPRFEGSGSKHDASPENGQVRPWRLAGGSSSTWIPGQKEGGVFNFLLCLLGGLALQLFPSTAPAQDGAYGRFDGSFHADLAVGAGLSEHEQASLVWHGRLRYVDAAGLVVRGDHALAESAVPLRLFAGLELRPLFPARFLMNSEFYVEWLDLLVDSVGVELGASFIGPVDVPPRLTMALGFDLPIVTPSMWNHGVYIHLSAEHVFGQGAYWVFSAALDLRLVFATMVGLQDPSR